MKEKISDIYDVRIIQDNIYGVYFKDEWERFLFKGTIVEVDAWISLREKDLI